MFKKVMLAVATPLLKDETLLEIVPVEEDIVTGPAKPVATFPFASKAVMVSGNAVPAVCGELTVDSERVFIEPGLTVNVLDIPSAPPLSEAVIRTPL